MLSSVSGPAGQPTAQAAAAPVQEPAPVQAAPAVPADAVPADAVPVAGVTVQISATAQVKQLDAAGSTLQEIVLKTGLDLATVRLLLGQ